MVAVLTAACAAWRELSKHEAEILLEFRNVDIKILFINIQTRCLVDYSGLSLLRCVIKLSNSQICKDKDTIKNSLSFHMKVENLAA